MTITRWCETGKLPATPIPYGKKTTWKISPHAVDLMASMEATKVEKQKAVEKERKQNKPHTEYKKAWVNAMSKGTLNGKVYSKRTIDDYCHYVDLYLGKYVTVSIEGLKKELMAIPAKMFAKREHYYKSVLCFSRFLVLEEALDKSFLGEMEPLYPKRHLPPKRKAIDETGINALLSACDTVQERLIVLLLAHTGLRASEACSLTWDDIDLGEARITVRLGKGNKTRKVGITSRLLKILNEYRISVPSAGHKPVLVNRIGKPMDRSGLLQRVDRLGKSVDIAASPHALRRAFVTINANKGRPLVILQRSCGHSDIKTTMSYCLTAEQEVIEAMKGWD